MKTLKLFSVLILVSFTLAAGFIQGLTSYIEQNQVKQKEVVSVKEVAKINKKFSCTDVVTKTCIPD